VRPPDYQLILFHASKRFVEDEGIAVEQGRCNGFSACSTILLPLSAEKNGETKKRV